MQRGHASGISSKRVTASRPRIGCCPTVGRRNRRGRPLALARSHIHRRRMRGVSRGIFHLISVPRFFVIHEEARVSFRFATAEPREGRQRRPEVVVAVGARWWDGTPRHPLNEAVNGKARVKGSDGKE